MPGDFAHSNILAHSYTLAQHLNWALSILQHNLMLKEKDLSLMKKNFLVRLSPLFGIYRNRQENKTPIKKADRCFIYTNRGEKKNSFLCTLHKTQYCRSSDLKKFHIIVTVKYNCLESGCAVSYPNKQAAAWFNVPILQQCCAGNVEWGKKVFCWIILTIIVLLIKCHSKQNEKDFLPQWWMSITKTCSIQITTTVLWANKIRTRNLYPWQNYVCSSKSAYFT